MLTLQCVQETGSIVALKEQGWGRNRTADVSLCPTPGTGGWHTVDENQDFLTLSPRKWRCDIHTIDRRKLLRKNSGPI